MTSDPYLTTLATHWIETFGSGDAAEIKQSERNPFSAFQAIVKGDPLYAWDLILEVIRLDRAKGSLDVLAAAPLEDFLSMHGESMIDYIEPDILDRADIRMVLAGIRKSGMSDKVWERVKKLGAAD